MEKFVDIVNRITKFIPFQHLPLADKCCFYIPLRQGCILTAVLCMVLSVGAVIKNTQSYSVCYPGLDVKVTSNSSRIIHAFLLASAVFMIYGALVKLPIAAALFALCLLGAILHTTIETVVWWFAKNSDESKCPPTYIFAGALLTKVLIYGYLLIIVHSYRLELLEENRENSVRERQDRVENLKSNVKENPENNTNKGKGQLTELQNGVLKDQLTDLPESSKKDKKKDDTKVEPNE